jgi:hypothetical protein
MKLQTTKKGVSLYLALIIMFILIAIGLGVSLIIVSQMKMIRGMGDSVIAFYGADTGIEHALYDVRQTNPPGEGNVSGSVGSASYVVNKLDGEWKSIGTHTLSGIKRGIQIKGGEIVHVEVRWFINATTTVNGLTAKKLDLDTEKTGSQAALIGGTSIGEHTAELGIKIWKRASDSSETPICGTDTSYAAIISDSPVEDPPSPQKVTRSATVDCSQTPLASDNSIVVRVYRRFSGGSWGSISGFTTQQLGGSSLEAATWTVSYTYDLSYFSAVNKTTLDFYIDGTNDSYISNFTWK